MLLVNQSNSDVINYRVSMTTDNLILTIEENQLLKNIGSVHISSGSVHAIKSNHAREDLNNLANY